MRYTCKAFVWLRQVLRLANNVTARSHCCFLCRLLDRWHLELYPDIATASDNNGISAIETTTARKPCMFCRALRATLAFQPFPLTLKLSTLHFRTGCGAGERRRNPTQGKSFRIKDGVESPCCLYSKAASCSSNCLLLQTT